jgi:uncharacterized protein YuzE
MATMNTARVEASYVRTFKRRAEIARQVFVDEGCILDVTAEGHLVGIEIIGDRTIFDVLPLVLAKARF